MSEPRPLIQVLVGPRQVGKTTAIKGLLANRGIYFSADSPVPFGPEEIEAQWSAALNLSEPLLAIDEVQKVRGWSEVVKQLWDQSDRRVKLVLLGSALSRKSAKVDCA